MLKETKWLATESVIIRMDDVTNITRRDSAILIEYHEGAHQIKKSMTFDLGSSDNATREWKMIIRAIGDGARTVHVGGTRIMDANTINNQK